MHLDERIPNMVSELKLDNIWPHFWPKNCRKLAKYPTLSVFDRFWPNMGSNVIQFQCWDQIWNPLIKAHLFDPKMKGLLILFWPPIVILKFWLPGAGWGWKFKKKMKHANVFPSIQGMIKSQEHDALLKKCLWRYTLMVMADYSTWPSRDWRHSLSTSMHTGRGT